MYYNTVKPPIKDTPNEDKPRQAESTLVYTLYRKSPLKEDNLSTKDKTAVPEGVLITVLYATQQVRVQELGSTLCFVL